MKAIVVETPGDIEALQLRDVPEPHVDPRDVLIQVDSCGVCYHDVLVRNGVLKRGVRLPLIPGHEIAGVVIGVGSDVPTFRPGDRVTTTQRYHICGHCSHCRTNHETQCEEKKFLGDWGMFGGYAERVAVEHDNVALVPDNVPLHLASVVACTMGSVFNAMRDVGHIEAGETVLVTGSGGGLGMQAVQLARLQGARVIAQTTSQDKVAQLEELGAHEVVVHERGADFSDQVKALTNGKGVNVVVDNVGNLMFQPIRRSLARSGRWLMIGQLTGDFTPFNPAQIFSKNIDMLSASSTTRLQLQQCLEIVARGQVKPIVSRRMRLEEARDAHRLIESGSVAGRIVLHPQG
ncbi:alcohol dehydrogenase catalytic domain-containing protein [Salipiger sp.]|uniref:alcohol dehydrogenase catalytic domain-containing protein n=1 Tax=Salipiger sp. TaxID=2078585 RepID=UPI003A97E4C2